MIRDLPILVISTIYLLSFMVSCQFQYTDIGTFSISFPVNTHLLGADLIAGQEIRAVMVWDQDTEVLYMKFGGNGTYISQVSGTPPLVHIETLTQDGLYTFKVQKLTSSPIFYQLNLYVDNNVVTTSTNIAVSSSNIKTLYKYEVTQTCPRAVFTSNQRSLFSNFYFYSPTKIPNIVNYDTDYTYLADSTVEQIMINLNQTGTWYFMPQDALTASPLTTYAIQTTQILIRCLLCGDSIRQDQQQCDNGNATGCINCVVGPQYRCTGNVGQASDCSCKTPRYYWDLGEGTCTINCTDVINTNGSVIGSTTQCECIQSFFYNMFTEMCIIDCSTIPHSSPVVGVIDRCDCQSGYEWTVNNTCIPRCGNGIKTQQEQCDDGNLVNGDGCSAICVNQQVVILTNNIPIIIGASAGGVVLVGALIGIIVYKKCIKRSKGRKIKSKPAPIHDTSSHAVIQ